MRSKVKATKTSEIQSVLSNFLEEFMKSLDNDLYNGICAAAWFPATNALSIKVIATPKSVGSRSQLLILHTSQAFLRSSNINFVKIKTKAFLSADIPLPKPNNKYMKNLFHDTGQSLPSENTCKKTVLQLSASQLQQMRNAAQHKQIFLVVDESTLSGIQYLNSLFGSIETPHVSYLCNFHPLPRAPNSNSIAQPVENVVRTFKINKNSFCLALYSAARYVVALGAILKSLYLKLFHVTCVAHLLHSCVMKVRSHFENVDQLIGSKISNR